jgi:hypothetical protein
MRYESLRKEKSGHNLHEKVEDKKKKRFNHEMKSFKHKKRLYFKFI